MKTKDLTNEQLQAYFLEHVRYEVQMLLSATFAITRALTVPQIIIHMPVESYAIHLRNLINFLHPNHIKETDVCAADFFHEKTTWDQIRPKLNDRLKNAKVRADKEVGHLTTLRKSGTPEDKIWSVKELTGDVMPLMEFFCHSADKINLKGTLEELKHAYSRLESSQELL